MSSIKSVIKDCLDLNIKLTELKLCFQNFGNLSLRIDKNNFVIKPSGVNLSKTKSKDFPIINIKNGKSSNSKLKPSSDTPTHLEIYKKYPRINGVAHTHSYFATAWAQSCNKINIKGTTHSDFSKFPIPVTKKLTKNQIAKNYEKSIGISIFDCLKKNKISPYFSPGVLVANHGPFAWGKTAEETIKNIEAIEIIAKLAFLTNVINPKNNIDKDLINKHFERKHGDKAYYGQ